MRKFFEIIMLSVLCLSVFVACGEFAKNSDSVSGSESEIVESEVVESKVVESKEEFFIITLEYSAKWNGDTSAKSVKVEKDGVISDLPEDEFFHWSYTTGTGKNMKSIEIKNGDTFKFDKDITITFISSYTENY